jgi:hypothetical protein
MEVDAYRDRFFEEFERMAQELSRSQNEAVA